MSHISVPSEGEAVFRLEIKPSFETPLRMEVWGMGKQGWFSARCRGVSPRLDLMVPPQRLRRGRWRSLINHVHQSRFWELPELQPKADFLIFDGSDLALEGQSGETYHRVLRHEEMELGLARTINFMLHASTLLKSLPGHVARIYLQDVHQPPSLRR